MTVKQEITKNNLLIAGFMGIVKGDPSTPSGRALEFEKGKFEDTGIIGDGFLRYRESWDALIPVAQRIERTKLGSIELRVKNLVYVSFGGSTKVFYTGTLIENMYDACVCFIEWYNKHKAIEG